MASLHRKRERERCNPINKHTLHFLADLNSEITAAALHEEREKQRLASPLYQLHNKKRISQMHTNKCTFCSGADCAGAFA
jgi:hypothetical protein